MVREVRRVPDARRDRQQRAEHAAMNRGGEHVDDRRAVAEAAVAAVRDAPPEQRRGAEETEVLDDVHAFVLERGVVERRHVPDPQREARGAGTPTAGAVSVCHMRRRSAVAGPRRAPRGADATASPTAARSAARSTAISGAATTISSSCCTMCAASHVRSTRRAAATARRPAPASRTRTRAPRTAGRRGRSRRCARARIDAGGVEPSSSDEATGKHRAPSAGSPRENLQREQRARRQTQDRHEPRPLPRLAAVGRHVARPCAAAQSTTSRRRRRPSPGCRS